VIFSFDKGAKVWLHLLSFLFEASIMPRVRPVNVMSPAPGSRLPKGTLLEVSGHPDHTRLVAAERIINQLLQGQALKLIFHGQKAPVWSHDPGVIAAFANIGEGRWALKISALNQARAIGQWSLAAREAGVKATNLTWDFSTSVREASFCARLRDRVAAKLDATVSVAPPALTWGQRVRQWLRLSPGAPPTAAAPVTRVQD
jgi:hypothetical protein